MELQPLSQSVEVLRQLERSTGEDLFGSLSDVAVELTDLVPSCVGFSMSYVREGVVVTFVATDEHIAALDAVQYATAGPCVDAIETRATLRTDDLADPLGEHLWQVFAQVSAAHGVRATVSLPVYDGARVAGGINIYASAPGAFEDTVDAVAALFGAWAQEAVRNADLTWTTRRDAERGPQLLADADVINQAIGVLAASNDVDRDTARTRITRAAVRAGIEPAAVATTILALNGLG